MPGDTTQARRSCSPATSISMCPAGPASTAIGQRAVSERICESARAQQPRTHFWSQGEPSTGFLREDRFAQSNPGPIARYRLPTTILSPSRWLLLSSIRRSKV